MDKTPHVYAEVIKAWADGADIQYRNRGSTCEWVDVMRPSWDDQYEYRVKPEPKKLYIQTVRGPKGDTLELARRDTGLLRQDVEYYTDICKYTLVGGIITVTLHEDA